MNVRRSATPWLILLTLSGACGCASWPDFEAPIPDVRPARKARSAQLFKEYEKHRDEASYQAAVSAWKQGNLDSCHELVDILLERDSKHRGARLLLVQLDMLDQDLEKADQEINNLAKEFPDDAEVLHVRGLVCEADGQLEQAEKNYRRAIELDPDNEVIAASLACLVDEEDPETNLEPAPVQSKQHKRRVPKADQLSAVLLKAEVHLALGEAAAAQRMLEQTLAQMPAEDELDSLLVRVCEATGDSVEFSSKKRGSQSARGPKVKWASHAAAGKSTDKASLPAGLPAADTPGDGNRAPASVEETLRCGETALAADTPTAACSYFQRAIAAAPDDESVAVRAAVAALRHDYPKLAVELAQSSLERWPKSAALYRTLGMAEYRQEHWQPAQAALRQALSLDNSHALSYFLLGCTLSKLGQNEEAERNFSQARQLDTRYALRP